MKRLALLVAIAAIAGIVPAHAAEDDLKLHPRGFGEHSYASWKAQKGLEDSTGGANQALYFQKMTTTPTNAAGVALVEGIDGTPASELSLEWERPDDGYCGAGAPRWTAVIEDTNTGTQQFVHVGCAAMQHEEGSDPAWTHDSFELPAMDDNFVVRALAIVFDEGNDVGPGFVYLDNIGVNGTMWTSAADNGR